MAFRTLAEYNDERNRIFFKLDNDGDFADVIFMYRNLNDVLLADAHYIKSSEYSGYIHCCGEGCPACERGIRVQTKIFVPVLLLAKNGETFENPEIKYFDRTSYFKDQIMSDIFNVSPNPSDCVFRIIRHGVARDTDTRYEIRAVGLNTAGKGTGMSHYDAILAKCGTSMPEDYERVIKKYPIYRLSELFSKPRENSAEVSNLSEYPVTPRVTVPTPTVQPVDTIMPPISTVVDAQVSSEVVPAISTESDDSTEGIDGDVVF